MAKKKYPTSYHVKVTFDQDFAHRRDPLLIVRAMYEKADEVAKGIKRHLDDLECEIVTVENCEHCNAEWTEHSTKYNGGCCDKDEAGNPHP